MISSYLGNMSQMLDMILAAIISVFLTLLFRGGPAVLYEDNKFVFRNLFWLVTIQFMGSIAVYILTSYFFASDLLIEYKSYKNAVSFLAALMPVEITLILLIILLYRLWLMLIKKVDPSFEEHDPLMKIRAIRSFYENREEKDEKNESTDKNNNNNTNKDGDNL